MNGLSRSGLQTDGHEVSHLCGKASIVEFGPSCDGFSGLIIETDLYPRTGVASIGRTSWPFDETMVTFRHDFAFLGN